MEAVSKASPKRSAEPDITPVTPEKKISKKAEEPVAPGAPKKKAPLPANQVLWIRTDGVPRWETVKIDEENKDEEEDDESDDSDVKAPGMRPSQIAYEEIRRLVGGDIESPPVQYLYGKKVPKPANGRHLQLYVNESGRLIGLDINEFARKHGQDHLCGDVMVALAAPGGRTVCFREQDLALLPKALVPTQ